MPFLLWGQAINVKTIPLIRIQQIIMAPSYNAGMGGISIGLGDALADGFTNPALLALVERNFSFAAPYQHSWTSRTGVFNPWGQVPVNTFQGSMVQGMPLDVVRRFELRNGSIRATAGLVLSMEQLRHRSLSLVFQDPDTRAWNRALQLRRVNWPQSGMLALQFPDKGISVGIGVDRVILKGVDGIPLLYPGASELVQDGAIGQYRLGISLDRPNEEHLEFLLLHKRSRMEQIAHYDWQESLYAQDEEISWLLSAKGRKPLETGALAGIELTLQRKWHPKIPDYPAPEIRIPRDPGITNAGRMGLGISNRSGKILFAMDAAVEIIDSKTWGDTTAAVTADNGSIIAAGEPLFSNDYFFVNTILRVGAEYHVSEKLRLQGGWFTTMYSVDYYHKDFVTGETITATPQNWWREPGVTAGVVARLGNLEWIFQTTRRRIASDQQTDSRWWNFNSPGVRTAVAGDLLVPPTLTGFADVPIVLYKLTLVYRL